MSIFWSVKQVADTIGVTAMTVRRYSESFGDFLSPDANPPSGHERRYVPRDVAVLQEAANLMGRLRDTTAVYDLIATDVDEGRWSSVTSFPEPGGDNVRLPVATKDEAIELLQVEIEKRDQSIIKLKEEIARLKGIIEAMERSGAQHRVEGLLQEVAVLKYRIKQLES